MVVDEVVQEIVDAVEAMAGSPYDGEPVDQLEHALQAAWHARAARVEQDAVVAALLHDIARSPLVAGIPYDGEREHHGETGARWLEPRVGARIAWLAESHVPAKRFLVATDPSYRAGLTPVSERTLQAQGGPMSSDEVEEFKRHPDWELAVAVRRFDDLGKDPEHVVPGVDAYRADLTAAVERRLEEAS
jgi:gamma-butyrobetaine dioxygenase